MDHEQDNARPIRIAGLTPGGAGGHLGARGAKVVVSLLDEVTGAAIDTRHSAESVFTALQAVESTSATSTTRSTGSSTASRSKACIGCFSPSQTDNCHSVKIAFACNENLTGTAEVLLQERAHSVSLVRGEQQDSR